MLRSLFAVCTIVSLVVGLDESAATDEWHDASTEEQGAKECGVDDVHDEDESAAVDLVEGARAGDRCLPVLVRQARWLYDSTRELASRREPQHQTHDKPSNGGATDAAHRTGVEEVAREVLEHTSRQEENQKRRGKDHLDEAPSEPVGEA